MDLLVKLELEQVSSDGRGQQNKCEAAEELSTTGQQMAYTCVSLDDGQYHVLQDCRVTFTLIQARIVGINGVEVKLHVVGVVVG